MMIKRIPKAIIMPKKDPIVITLMPEWYLDDIWYAVYVNYNFCQFVQDTLGAIDIFLNHKNKGYQVFLVESLSV